MLWYKSFPRSYGSWIYIYLCNQCFSSLQLWDKFSLCRGVLDTIYVLKLSITCIGLVDFFLFSGTPVSSTNITDHHDIMKYCWICRSTPVTTDQIETFQMYLIKYSFSWLKLHLNFDINYRCQVGRIYQSHCVCQSEPLGNIDANLNSLIVNNDLFRIHVNVIMNGINNIFSIYNCSALDASHLNWTCWIQKDPDMWS